MSYVSTVMIVMPILDDEVHGIVYATDMHDVSPGCTGGMFERCGTSDVDHLIWGGTKAPQVCLAAGAFNYLSTDDLLTWLASLPWEYPDNLQVLINGEHDTGFTLWTLDQSTGSWTPHREVMVGNDFFGPNEPFVSPPASRTTS